ncbi:MAG: bifunctional ornithine acetyltransferase/N-acetylglutamate synthase, partial [Lachnospiraceae bacterium]
MKVIEGGVCAAKGFKAACCEANIKYKNRTDMAMVYSEMPCECAGTFTSNVVKAACVQWDQKLVYSGEKMQAVVVNSGIANACTGQEGFDACEATAKAVEKELGVKASSVAVASTGVIGMQLPVEKLVNGVAVMSGKLEGSTEAGTNAAKAIMTTDTVHKEIAVTFDVAGKTVTLGGMCKGSG